MTARKKTAVVITHGIGEQLPMETLRSFVDAVWTRDSGVHWQSPPDEDPADTWMKPDAMAGSFELRRITTRWMRGPGGPADKGPRVDFFEFYWADLAEGTTVQEVYDWVKTLLVRWPSDVPPGLGSAWLLLWASALAVASLSLLAIWPWKSTGPHVAFAAAAAVAAWLMQHVVSPYAGDIARYVRADPRNVATRRQIRERGLELLGRLSASGRYDRIVFVAHSLGTIVAYDLIALLWAQSDAATTVTEGTAAFDRLREVERAGAALAGAATAEVATRRDAFRAAQRALSRELAGHGGTPAAAPWLVTDFVTLGSPLTHASFLLARDATDLAGLQSRFLFPTCPPRPQPLDQEQRDKIGDRTAPTIDLFGPEGGLYSYYDRDRVWRIHHAAPFATVRWTNIHDPHRLVFIGDIISGPLSPTFGTAIRDEDLAKLRGPATGFSHTSYWDVPKGRPDPKADIRLAALRGAVHLRDE